MEITRVELIRSREPVTFPEPWEKAWKAPEPEPVPGLRWSLVRVHTDEGYTGIGPGVGDPGAVDLVGYDPFAIEQFWLDHMSHQHSGNDLPVAGLEIALWDVVGKAVGEPIHKLLGGSRDRIDVYNATTRLLPPDELATLASDVEEAGFSSIKLRLHRDDLEDDLEAVRAVREAVADDVAISVDANQNHASDGYEFWSRATALRTSRALDELGVEFIEEPLPRRDVEGLARIADAVDTPIAGGEHSRSIYDFKGHLRRGAYDVIQPDVFMRGHIGITGLKKAATVADFFDRDVVPHTISGPLFPLAMAASLQVAASAANVTQIEFTYDPPVLTPETNQSLLEEPFWVDDDGLIKVPDGPGLGLVLDEELIESDGEVVWSSG